MKFLRKHALLAAANSRGIISSTTAAAVVLTSNPPDEKVINSEQHSSILLYDRPIMRPPPVPAKRSGYRYNFDYEQTSDLRFIYQQLRSLKNNVAQLRNKKEEEEEEGEEEQEIYLPPNRSITKKQSQVKSHFHNMPTIQRR